MQKKAQDSVRNIVIASFFLLALGCSDNNKNSAEPDTPPESTIDPNQLNTDFELLDKFDQTSSSFNQNEIITFSMSATNSNGEVIILQFNNGQRYDFYVLNDDNRELWRWSADKSFTQALEQLEIQPEETIKLAESWNQQLTDGSQLEPGNYTAVGYYHDQTQTVEFDFSIQ